MIKQMRKAMNAASAIAILFLVIKYGSSIAESAFAAKNKSYDNAGFYSWIDILSSIVVVAVILIGINFSKQGREHREGCVLNVRVQSRQKMTIPRFILCLLAVIVVVSVANLVGSGVEGIDHQLGFNTPTSEDLINRDLASSGVAFVSVNIVAPIVEELVFRGTIMPRLERFGSLFAIITSATMFGLMHRDFPQGSAAFIMGLALGWVANNYSVIWSILMHMFNNLVLVSGCDWLTTKIGEDTVDTTTNIVFFAALAIICVVLYLRRRQIKTYMTNGRSQVRHPYLSWISPLFIILASFCIAEAVLSLLNISLF